MYKVAVFQSDKKCNLNYILTIGRNLKFQKRAVLLTLGFTKKDTTKKIFKK